MASAASKKKDKAGAPDHPVSRQQEADIQAVLKIAHDLAPELRTQ